MQALIVDNDNILSFANITLFLQNNKILTMFLVII